jgi:hypothetical protein
MPRRAIQTAGTDTAALAFRLFDTLEFGRNPRFIRLFPIADSQHGAWAANTKYGLFLPA